MTSSTINPDQSSITIGSSSGIDFAIWVLLEDGLHVLPFDKHSGGNQVLQSLGMTRESWQEWLKLILIRHDNRLSWHVPNIDAAATEDVESFKKLIDIASEAHNIKHNIVFDQQWHDHEYELSSQRLINQEQGYQEALADYQGLDVNFIKESNPPQLYQGNPEVKERLLKLWDDYQPIQDSNKFIEPTLLTPKMMDVQSNPPTSEHREVFLVDYPFEVEIFIPPIFALVSVPNCPLERSVLDRRIFDVLQYS